MADEQAIVKLLGNKLHSGRCAVTKVQSLESKFGLGLVASRVHCGGDRRNLPGSAGSVRKGSISL